MNNENIIISDKMDNQIVKDLVIFGIIIIIAAIAFSFIFAPSSDAKTTNIDILNKGDFGTNSTIYVKLTDAQKNSLSNKTVHVKLTDNKGKVVYEKSIKTHATGVGMAKLSNITSGAYTLNVTYDGDGNYTGCSISKNVKVDDGVVKDEIDNSTLDNATIQDILDSQAQSDSDQSSQQQQSYTPSDSGSDSNSQSSSSDDSGYVDYYDSDGNKLDPVIDPDGNQIDPSDG